MSDNHFLDHRKFLSVLNRVEKTRYARTQLRHMDAIDAKENAQVQADIAKQQHETTQQELLTRQEAIHNLTQTGLDLLLFGASCKRSGTAMEGIAASHAESLRKIELAKSDIKDCVAGEIRSLVKLDKLVEFHKRNEFGLETVVTELDQEELITAQSKASSYV